MRPLVCHNIDNARLMRASAFGHYEDKLVKLGGHSFFVRRKVFNELMPDRTATISLSVPVRY
jgi:hypothetical protein